MPISTVEFREYAKRLELSELAINYLNQTRSSAPARRVESNSTRNTVWRYPSTKMGMTIALESSEEFALAIQLEYDTEVLEYWEQPPRVALVVIDSNGHRRRCSYVPDFLVVKRNEVQVVQVKPADQCERLSREQPQRWAWNGEAARDIAASAHFSGIGLQHVVYSSGQEHKILVDNCRLMLHLQDAVVAPETTRKLAKTLVTLSDDEVLSVDQLMRTAGIPTATPIVRLVKQGDLFSDLNRWRLSVPSECFVSRSPKAIVAHTSALDALAPNGKATLQLSSAELLEAHHRLLVLQGRGQTHRSRRSIRRWRAKLQISIGDPLSLKPHHRNKGNRNPRLSDEEEELLASSLRTHYVSSLCTSLLAAYGQYLLDHEKALAKRQLSPSSVPASYTTYSARSRRIPDEELAKERSGKRAAATAAQPTSPSLKHLSPSRAFERAHVDHYLCDIHVIVAEGKKRHTRRPQLTAMRDEATGAVLAFSLSFNAPSRYSCLGVIRDCVRRHGRLPETIVTDNGAEFHAEYFELALARLGITIQRRPPGCPRYGSTIEAWFHSLKAFLSAQRGNTNNDVRGRSATTSHKGRSHATWTLSEAHLAIEVFAFDLFNGTTSSSDVDSRLAKSTKALSMFPESGILTPFCADFLAITAMPAKKALKVDLARGIRHLGRWFTHPKLFGPGVASRRLQIFEEPWDMNTVYALVDDVLVPCRHGSVGTADLRTDFSPALESIRYLECSDIRSVLRKEAAIESAKLVRQLATTLEPQSEQKAQREQPNAPRTSSSRNSETIPLKTEYWP